VWPDGAVGWAPAKHAPDSRPARRACSAPEAAHSPQGGGSPGRDKRCSEPRELAEQFDLARPVQAGHVDDDVVEPLLALLGPPAS
jgi:hypothetical protein